MRQKNQRCAGPNNRFSSNEIPISISISVFNDSNESLCLFLYKTKVSPLHYLENTKNKKPNIFKLLTIYWIKRNIKIKIEKMTV